MNHPDYLERLVKIVSCSRQVERVSIDYCLMDGATIKPIIAALYTSLPTMRSIRFWGVNWNTNNYEAILELTNFIAKAPKIEFCSIRG